ncbi:methyltransferase-like protein 7A isoform X1 [Tripterygium wilfordii]|uniref:Methyltransferase-like protein 7A isoform X1 n=1 Tax=Tripterygium wilfordii TaxID=458696 RepID=A0A7J7E0M8_TRIWF|nr:methyltransferase-like protein 7A [Tripterygium wilfordii]KAF5752081.1 methyltransferase-like protein 7A isoform X1 [Tripterygium wilfordii]
MTEERRKKKKKKGMNTMILHSPFPFRIKASRSSTPIKASSSSTPIKDVAVESKPLRRGGFCSCGRRHFLEGAAASCLPIRPSKASEASQSDYVTVLNRVHPPRPDWYEEFYASVINSSMKAYEAEISGYKSKLFNNLGKDAKKVMEIGIGTGPNLRYYGSDADVQVFGIDPNKKMEKYAKEAAMAAGLPLANFKFIQAVGEAIPLSDASVDAVVGTLVLCSVKDVDATLRELMRVLKPGGIYLFVEHVAAKDGTILRLIQSVLDPLQQTVSDGCHLTRETGKNILKAGFSGVDLSNIFLSNASIVSPHVYGIAHK